VTLNSGRHTAPARYRLTAAFLAFALSGFGGDSDAPSLPYCHAGAGRVDQAMIDDSSPLVELFQRGDPPGVEANQSNANRTTLVVTLAPLMLIVAISGATVLALITAAIRFWLQRRKRGRWRRRFIECSVFLGSGVALAVVLFVPPSAYGTPGCRRRALIKMSDLLNSS
jgi:hypothetical protein